MATLTEGKGLRLVLSSCVFAALCGCAAPTPDVPSSPQGGFSVTAWGEEYEVFPVVGPLIAGETSVSHTHVTRLDGFAPLESGTVEIVLSGPSGEQTFLSTEPTNPGIFAVEISPASAEEADLSFRITSNGITEEIRGGRVRVGTRDQPGGLTVARVPKGATGGGEPLDFLKEEQWSSDFSTAWVRTQRLLRSVQGAAKVRPHAGGEATVTSPVDGVVHAVSGSASWPFEGRRAKSGAPLFRVIPRVAVDRSLPTLEAEVETLSSELVAARARQTRLDELLTLDAASPREVEEAGARVDILEARFAAATRDLESARSSRGGGTGGGSVLRSPFSGEIASVSVTPGSTVSAGEPLARLVQTDPLWLEVALRPDDARKLGDGVVGVVISDGENAPIRIEEGVRFVSLAPEVSPRTGTVSALLELPPVGELTLGASVQAQLLLAEQQLESEEGTVVPSSALVDDGGVSIVYLQLAGESFARQEVDIAERQGEQVVVVGVSAGQRLVSRGGESIRRSSLMTSGQAHGHVH